MDLGSPPPSQGGTFGAITTQYNLPRFLHIGIRVSFWRISPEHSGPGFGSALFWETQPADRDSQSGRLRLSRQALVLTRKEIVALDGARVLDIECAGYL